MPLVRRKKVVTYDIPAGISADAASGSSRDVFYIPQTGEIFSDYESYSARMAFYNMKVFQCELTGKSGLDYFQALDSERTEAITLHARFPAQLKSPVLTAVQWQIMGRLDHLVELVYDRFVNRYFKGENVFVDVGSEKYYARIVKVSPPKLPTNGDSSPNPASTFIPHSIGVDLRVSLEETIVRDDPIAYFYGVRMIDESEHTPQDDQERQQKDDLGVEKWSGSEMEVKANALSRDRLSFSKSILRRFIRDCVDRDAAVASPWTVKSAIAEQHGVATQMPDDVRRAIDGAKAGEKEKRKKVWEDKLEAEGGPAAKRRRRPDEQESKTSTPTPVPLDSKPKPRGPIKYPIDDLDVVLTERGKRTGKQMARPAMDIDVPFGRHFETFLMSWSFFQSFGAVLKISSFTLDEFESALNHNVPDTPCPLLAELHACLLGVAKERPSSKYIALDSIAALHQDGTMDVDDTPNTSSSFVPLDELMDEAKGLGYRAHISGDSSSSKDIPRAGWEDGLAIYIRDHALVETVPNLRRIMQSLIFSPSTSTQNSKFSPSSPADRYVHLHVEDKLAIISFLCEISMSSRAIRAHIDWGDAALTELRKEKIEVNREKRRLMDEIAQLDAKLEPEVEPPENNPPPVSSAEFPSPAPGVSDDEPELPQNGYNSDATDDGPSRRRRPSGLRRASLKNSSDPQGKLANIGKDRAKARLKAAEVKFAVAERRRLDEDLNKTERRLEAIEREFRQLFGVGRSRHMGKDRFFNRYWWLDGMGSGVLVNSSGTTVYGTGRIFVQGPSEPDLLIISGKGETVVRARQQEEDGPGRTLEPGAWGVYSVTEQLEQLMAWFNPKGYRELALKNNLSKWLDYIASGMKRRQLDLSSPAQPDPEPERRSTRGNVVNTPDPDREPYMLWTNRHHRPSR